MIDNKHSYGEEPKITIPGQKNPKQAKDYAIIAIVLGGLSLIAWPFILPLSFYLTINLIEYSLNLAVILGIITAPLGIYFACKAKRLGADKNLWTAALITSIIGTVKSVVLVILAIITFYRIAHYGNKVADLADKIIDKGGEIIENIDNIDNPDESKSSNANNNNNENKDSSNSRQSSNNFIKKQENTIEEIENKQEDLQKKANQGQEKSRKQVEKDNDDFGKRHEEFKRQMEKDWEEANRQHEEFEKQMERDREEANRRHEEFRKKHNLF